MPNLLETVINDSVDSENRWDAAVEDDPQTWTTVAAQCSDHYHDAIAAIQSGDLDSAEIYLEKARHLEAIAGDDCDARHALFALRSRD